MRFVEAFATRFCQTLGICTGLLCAWMLVEKYFYAWVGGVPNCICGTVQ
jgi:hypothetical protein